jgi:hypothetical protein
MEEFIVQYWPFLIAPAYIVLFVIACWGYSIKASETDSNYRLTAEDKAACFIFTIPFSAVTIFASLIILLFAIVYYLAQIISKALYFVLPR